MPSATMKLQHNAAMNASDRRLPSRNPSTSPKTMPRGSLLRNRQTIPGPSGRIPNSSHATSATAMRPSSVPIRRRAGISAITRMPISFEAV